MKCIKIWLLFAVLISSSNSVWAQVFSGEIQSINQQKKQLKIEGKTFYAIKKITVTALGHDPGVLGFKNLSAGMFVEVKYKRVGENKRRQISTIKLLVH